MYVDSICSACSSMRHMTPGTHWLKAKNASRDRLQKDAKGLTRRHHDVQLSRLATQHVNRTWNDLECVEVLTVSRCLRHSQSMSMSMPMDPYGLQCRMQLEHTPCPSAVLWRTPRFHQSDHMALTPRFLNDETE
jgi:hypothetical protein